MKIFTSTLTFNSYLERLDFASIYKEPSLALPVKSNVKIGRGGAAEYLLGSALAGNKTIGFFNYTPRVQNDKPLRGVCVLVSHRLTPYIDIPTFFIKSTDRLNTIFPKAVKASADWGVPVSVVISPNVMNNYIKDEMVSEEFDRQSPYISKELPYWDYASYYDRISSLYEYVSGFANTQKLREQISFYSQQGDFPEFIVPLCIEAQKKYFGNIKNISTSLSEKKILEFILPELGLEGINITAEIVLPEYPVYPALCPGCPVGVLFANGRMEGKLVFSSLECEAVKQKFGLKLMGYQEFLGLTAKKNNIETSFIGSLSEMPVSCKSLLDNKNIIALNDTGEKTFMPQIKNIFKFKAGGVQVFPYGCENIMRYPKIKYKAKRCNCVKEEGLPECIQKSGCAALTRGNTTIAVNAEMCTGCRVCTSFCTNAAIY